MTNPLMMLEVQHGLTACSSGVCIYANMHNRNFSHAFAEIAKGFAFAQHLIGRFRYLEAVCALLMWQAANCNHGLDGT